MNGLKVQTPEELQEIAEKDLPLALGLIFEGIVNIQQQCRCRLDHCKEKMIEQEKMFVKKKHVYIAVLCVISLMVGLGALNWQSLLKMITIVI